MVIDIYHSRRMNFRKCKFWLPSDNREWSEWTTRNEPLGVFYAREVSPLRTNGNKINASFLTDRTEVTLETSDNLSSITKGCIVEYLHHLWMVDSIQATPHVKESQYTGEVAGTYTVNLRR